MGGIFGGGGKTPEAPKPVEIKQPVVEQEVVDRQASDLLRRRRGYAATITGASESGTTAGSVAAKTLLGQ